MPGVLMAFKEYRSALLIAVLFASACFAPPTPDSGCVGAMRRRSCVFGRRVVPLVCYINRRGPRVRYGRKAPPIRWKSPVSCRTFRRVIDWTAENGLLANLPSLPVCSPIAR